MFEVIGYISVSLFLTFLIALQYSMLINDIRNNNLNKIDMFISWVPLLPYVLMVLLTIYYLIEFTLYRLNRWFELKWGWFFINGRKQSEWAEYLRNKYKD
jgi:hypothetical protein